MQTNGNTENIKKQKDNKNEKSPKRVTKENG